MDDFVVYSADEKYLADFLVYHMKRRNWKGVVNVALELIELEIKEKHKQKEYSADGGQIKL